MRILLARPVHERPHEIVPDLGLGYLATSLLKAQHDVKILDCSKEGLGFDGFRTLVRDTDYDVIGLKIFSNEVLAASKMIETIKDRKPDCVVVIGGPHVSGMPVKTMEALPGADYGFQGEAETGFPMLLEWISRNNVTAREKIPGLLFRDGGKARKNRGTFSKELDSLGMPAWSLMPPQSYPKQSFGLFVKNFPTAPLITTRGCPFHCTYCAGYKVTGRTFRKRGVQAIMDELLLLKNKYGVKDVTIVDDNFTLHKSFVMSVCEAMTENRIGLSWSCPNGVRLDSLDRELLQTMEASGCYSVSVGVESGSDRILSSMKKSLKVETIRDKVRLIRSSSRIKVTGFFILGFPGEERSDMEKTVSLSRELDLDRAAFSIFSPFPGTEVYEEMVKEATVRDAPLDSRSLDFDYVTVTPDDMKPQDIKWMQRNAILRFYLRPRVLWRLLREIRTVDQVKIIFQRLSYAMK